MANASVDIPLADGTTTEHRFAEPSPWRRPKGPLQVRTALAAAHVVAARDAKPTGEPESVDWERTMAYRRFLWSWGLGVAEAMDTSERGPGGLNWRAVRELIARSVHEAAEVDGTLVCGAGTDQLDPVPDIGLDAIVTAYEEQCGYVEEQGGRCVVMCSRALAATSRRPDSYHEVYDRVLGQLSRPVILHWLGEVFDPALAGYWGANTFEDQLEVVVELIGRHRDIVDGIKFSMLDDAYERELRRRLPEGVRLYTGDDFNYTALLVDDEDGRHSHALLGVLDAIAPAASTALQALEAGDRAGYDAALGPTVPLARHLFAAPSSAYKTGVVFLAWLNGHQDEFRMVSGQTSARDREHLVQTCLLADRAGLLSDPELAAHRLEQLLT